MSHGGGAGLEGMVIMVLLILFVLWIMNGGPAKSKNADPFVDPTDDIQTISPANIQELNTN